MYPYDWVPFLIPEMDCIRILSNTEHEMLQKIPKCINNVLGINSQKPSSYLYGAHQKYEVSKSKIKENNFVRTFIEHCVLFVFTCRERVINRMSI